MTMSSANQRRYRQPIEDDTFAQSTAVTPANEDAVSLGWRYIPPAAWTGDHIENDNGLDETHY